MDFHCSTFSTHGVTINTRILFYPTIMQLNAPHHNRACNILLYYIYVYTEQTSNELYSLDLIASGRGTTFSWRRKWPVSVAHTERRLIKIYNFRTEKRNVWQENIRSVFVWLVAKVYGKLGGTRARAHGSGRWVGGWKHIRVLKTILGLRLIKKNIRRAFGATVLMLLISCLLHLVATAYFFFLEILGEKVSATFNGLFICCKGA